MKESKAKRPYRKTSETQKIIFDKAMSIMTEKGFQGTTVREICAEAKIPIGTFYNCYKSKVEILKSIYDNGDAYLTSAEEEINQETNSLTKLRKFGYYYAKLNESTGIEAMKVLFFPTNEWFSQSRPMQQMLTRIIEEGQQNGSIRNDLNSDYIVLHIFDILRGVCYNWCIYNGSFNLTERIDLHMDLLTEVLSK